jgi:hypothetical protein
LQLAHAENKNMENLYPVFAVLAAIVALGLGAAELIFLEIKPAAVITWIGGWGVAMSLTFSSPFGLVVSSAIAIVITALYAIGVSKILAKPSKTD